MLRSGKTTPPMNYPELHLPEIIMKPGYLRVRTLATEVIASFNNGGGPRVRERVQNSLILSTFSLHLKITPRSNSVRKNGKMKFPRPILQP